MVPPPLFNTFQLSSFVIQLFSFSLIHFLLLGDRLISLTASKNCARSLVTPKSRCLNRSNKNPAVPIRPVRQSVKDEKDGSMSNRQSSTVGDPPTDRGDKCGPAFDPVLFISRGTAPRLWPTTAAAAATTITTTPTTVRHLEPVRMI